MVLKIQDKEYLLKYDVNSLVLLEEISGYTLDHILQHGMGFKALRDMLFVGLRRNHKEIDMEQVGDLIQDFLNEGQSPAKLGELLYEAFSKSNLVRKKK